MYNMSTFISYNITLLYALCINDQNKGTIVYKYNSTSHEDLYL